MRTNLDINLSLIIFPLGNASTIIQVGYFTFWTQFFYLLSQLFHQTCNLLTKVLIYKNVTSFKFMNVSWLFFPAVLLLFVFHFVLWARSIMMSIWIFNFSWKIFINFVSHISHVSLFSSLITSICRLLLMICLLQPWAKYLVQSREIQ